MKWESIKVLPLIKELYEMPRTPKRFENYLWLLQGAKKNEMILPIAAFNPMGKELAMEKLNKLMEFKAEQILDEVISRFNTDDRFNTLDDKTIQVAINLIDDVEGSWSNFFTTDFKSKFAFKDLLNRNFCTPVFWTSETVNEKSITRRIEEYMFRTMYWLKQGQPRQLSDMLDQEMSVQMNYEEEMYLSDSDIAYLTKFIRQYKNSEDYVLNFNFFYGDEGSKNLNYTTYGIIKNGGFEFAKFKARRQNGNDKNND